jgi:hypothetical protein
MASAASVMEEIEAVITVDPKDVWEIIGSVTVTAHRLYFREEFFQLEQVTRRGQTFASFINSEFSLK